MHPHGYAKIELPTLPPHLSSHSPSVSHPLHHEPE
jgi:hypothetical protein